MLKKEVIALNKERSDEYCTPSARDARAMYASIHPTNILVFKCMDGRINLPLITGIPMGILHPFRHIGGKFVLGDPYLGRLVLDEKESAVRQGRPSLALCTYHYSKGDAHRGCAGHAYDTNSARNGAIAHKQEFDKVFGTNNPAMAAIILGIETDEDSLIFTNESGDSFSIAENCEASDMQILSTLTRIYPNTSKQMLDDILPLALGNRAHVKSIKLAGGRPPSELVHGENIICVGRGFDWLHLPNRALIIGPYEYYDHTWRDAIAIAGKIVLNNFENNPELKKGGALLISSAPYRDLDEKGIAMMKADFFCKVAQDALGENMKILSMETLVGVTDLTTMKFHQIEVNFSCFPDIKRLVYDY